MGRRSCNEPLRLLKQADAPKVRNFFRETGMLVHTSRAIQKRSIVHLQKRVDINHDTMP
jgi:hypothetical protein